MTRQILLDTETTGLEVSQGHRIIEIGCVELINRRLTGNNYHCYINPEREVDEGALAVHGINNAFLADKPVFGRIASEFLEYLGQAELVIHNALFDLGFLDYELQLLRQDHQPLSQRHSVIDTLVEARRKHPGQRNSLDALCKRYHIDNSQRDLHGALLDAEILADVYLAMTGGQSVLALESDEDSDAISAVAPRSAEDRPPMTVITASATELAAHEAMLDLLDKSGAGALWRSRGDS